MIVIRVALALSLAGSGQVAGAWASLAAERIVVTSQDASSLTEIDPESDRAVAQVTVGHGPANLAASVDGREIFVTHPDGATIDVVDAAGGRVVRAFPYRGEAFGIATAPDVIFVSDWTKHVVIRLDAATGRPTGSVGVGKSPAGLVVDRSHRRLYAADRESGDVAVIDIEAMRVIARIVVGSAPFALALAPDGTRLYVANVRSNDLAVIDTARLRRIVTVPAGAMPYGVAVTPDGRAVLVTNQHGDTLRIFDARTLSVTASVPVGRYPEGVIVLRNHAYVANWFSGDVSVVDLGQLREVKRIKVGDGPRNFALLPGQPRSP